MSESSEHQHKATPESTTEDPAAGVNAKTIVTVGVIALSLFIASAVVAYIMLVNDEKMIAAAGPPNPTAQFRARKEIGIVDFVHYDADDRLPLWRADMATKLNGYSWADKAKGKVRLPIAEGIKRAIAEAAVGSPIGEANAKVMHEPNVPRLTLGALIADPSLARNVAETPSGTSPVNKPLAPPSGPKSEIK